MPNILPPIELEIPVHVRDKLGTSNHSVSLEAVLHSDDRRRSKAKLNSLGFMISATVSKFLAQHYPDFNTSPKATKAKILAGAKGSYFGFRIKLVCSELQLAELLSLTEDSGFLDLGTLGSSNFSLRMLFTPQQSAKQPAQPAATDSRVYQLRLDNLPEGIVNLPLDDVSAIFESADFKVLSKHPVLRSGTPAADSMVVVVKTSVPLSGRRALNFSGFPGRTGKVRSHFTVNKYPALPPLAVVCPWSSAAAAAATPAAAASAAPKPASAASKAVARPAAAKAAQSAAVHPPAAPAMPAAAEVQPARAAPASAASAAATEAAAVTAVTMPHGAVSQHAHASAAQPAPASHKRVAPQQQPDDSSQPTAHAASAPPRKAIAGSGPPHGPSLPPRAPASHSARAPPAAPLAAPASAGAVALPAPVASAAAAAPPGFLNSRAGSAFSFQFAGPDTRAAAKHQRHLQLTPTPEGVVVEDTGAAPPKRQELAAAAQSAPKAAGDAKAKR